MNPWATLANPPEHRPGDAGQDARIKGGPISRPKAPPNPWKLTGKEYEIIGRIRNGESQAQLAKAYGYCKSTLSKHGNSIREKMGAGTLAHAAVIFDRHVRPKE